jgi:2-pyrone-4,6-dicarboxylate lactonase
LLGTAHAGHLMLRQLLGEGCIWVKLSGIANISEAAPAYDDVRRVHESLVAANADQLVWGSDWPHTRPAGEVPRTADLFERFLEWTPSSVDRECILSSNARRLYRL